MTYFPLKIKELCTPSKVYLYLSFIGLVASAIQNLIDFDNNTYKCGAYAVIVPSVMLIFLFKFIYITFWAYVLNLICKDNQRMLSWFLVLFPVLFLFVIIGILMLTGGQIVTSKPML
jgi:hypothetical protein